MTFWDTLGGLLDTAWASSVIWFGGVLAVMAFIRKVSKDADDDLDDAARNELARRLLRIDENSTSSWLPDFTRVFDRFFGEKHFGWRCFYRSILISVASFTSMIYIVNVLDYQDPVAIGVFIVLMGFFGLLINGFADYFSLLETRLLLNSRYSTTVKIVVDLVLTFFLTFFWIVFVNFLVDPGSSFSETFISNWNDLFFERPRIGQDPSRKILIIIIITGYSTSIWLWLHGLAQLAIYAVRKFSWVINFLNVRQKPLRALGLTMNIFILVIGVALFPFVVLVR